MTEKQNVTIDSEEVAIQIPTGEGNCVTITKKGVEVLQKKFVSINVLEKLEELKRFTDIPLTGTTVSKFLYESGFTGRTKTKRVNEIIESSGK